MSIPGGISPEQRCRGPSGTTRCTVNVALVVPLQGPAGIFGPSCELCAQLAVETINAEGGLLGQEVSLVVVDGGQDPLTVALEVEALVVSRSVDAVVGWHISAVRRALAPRIAHLVPYIYTALYEGGERTPGVFLTGEVPSEQLRPAIRWLVHERSARRWAIVGNDYVWPRVSAVAARRYLACAGARVCAEIFVPLATDDFTGVIDSLRRAEPDAVLMLLVGDDAVRFNRAFAAAELDDACLRFSPLMEENMLLATGAFASRGICSAAGYFEALVTADSLDFGGLYARRFGTEAPMLNSLGESCYEGLHFLAVLAQRAGTLDVRSLSGAADQARYHGPRGERQMRGRHLRQSVYLADAQGLDLVVVAQL